MSRNAPLALAAAAAVLALAVPALAPAPAQAAAAASQPNFTGVWVLANPPTALMQANGQLPPFTAAAKRTYDERVAARRSNAASFKDPAADCVPHGIPRLLTTRYPVEILQTPQRMSFVHEVNHTFRVIPIGKPHPAADELNPLWLGNQSARWEGDTFVIDNVGFNGMTWLDAAGTPTSEKLHVVERWRMTAPNRLQVQLTIEDPEVFTRPWNTTLTFEKRDGLKLKESVCRENKVY